MIPTCERRDRAVIDRRRRTKKTNILSSDRQNSRVGMVRPKRDNLVPLCFTLMDSRRLLRLPFNARCTEIAPEVFTLLFPPFALRHQQHKFCDDDQLTSLVHITANCDSCIQGCKPDISSSTQQHQHLHGGLQVTKQESWTCRLAGSFLRGGQSLQGVVSNAPSDLRR